MWYLYAVRCSDSSFYIGITTDIRRRLHAHNHTRKGARYTRRRRPVTLVWCAEVSADVRQALRAERWLKRHHRTWKQRLFESGNAPVGCPAPVKVLSRVPGSTKGDVAAELLNVHTVRTTMAKKGVSASAEGKKSKKGKAEKSGAGKGSGNSSLQHLIGQEVEIVFRAGDRPSKTVTATIEEANGFGVRFTYIARKASWTEFAPFTNIVYIERKVGKGTGENLEGLVKWVGGAEGKAAAPVVGQRCTINYHDGGRPDSFWGYVGCVDSLGVGFAYSSYGSERLAFVPNGSLVSVALKQALEE